MSPAVQTHPFPDRPLVALRGPLGADELQATIAACDAAVAYCVRRGGRQAQGAHLGLLVDCIELGQATLDLGRRKSPALPGLAAVCAAAFRRAAEESRALGGDAELSWCATLLGQAADGLDKVVA